MCGGVQYQYNGETVKTYFPNPKAELYTVIKEI